MKPEILPLTSLRGIAALLVLIYHIRSLNEWTFFLDDHTSLFSRGYLWVDFFFILSGFVMTYSYAALFDGTFAARAYLKFLKRRWLRLYPLHFATLLLFVPIVMFDLYRGVDYHSSAYIPSFLLNVTLTHALYYVEPALWNGPSWSISAEMFAYALFPLFLIFAFRTKFMLSVLFVGSGVFCLYIMSTFTYENNLNIFRGFYGVLRCFAGFCLGILICRGFEALRGAGADGPGVRWIGHDGTCLVLAVGIALLLHLAVHDIVLLPVFALLILAVALNAGVAKGILETPMPYGLGLISYSLYMTHWFVIEVTGRIRDGLEPAGVPIGVLMLGAALMTIALSVVTYRWIEQPFRTWPPRMGHRARRADSNFGSVVSVSERGVRPSPKPTSFL